MAKRHAEMKQDGNCSLRTTIVKRWLRVGILAAMAAAGLCVLNPFAPPQQAAPPRASHDDHAGPGTPETRKYTLLFTGDVMLSRTVGARMQAKKDWALPFRLIADTMRNADLRYGNLECPVSDRGSNLHHLYSFRADPRAIEGLKAAGFNVVSQANNHTYDWGPDALLDSLKRLRAAGIYPVGAGENIREAHRPLVVTVGDVRIAFLAYVDIDPKQAAAGPNRPGVAWLDHDQAVADIRAARRLADLVIVCPHWGVEYALKPDHSQVVLAHQMIDAGADMIVGSHPHVVQPLENYHGHWIAYSLGNFVFDQKSPGTHHGMMLRATVCGKQIVDVRRITIRINSSFQAAVAPADEQQVEPVMADRNPQPVHHGE